MFNGRKKLIDDKTIDWRERGGQKKMEQPLPPVRHASGLLDMLAEVASQTLHSDPSVKASPAKKKAAERNVREPKEHKELKESSRKKRSEVDTLTAAKLRSLSLSQQLRLCSRLDGDEMRRTFTYTCLLEPDLCGQTFSSFGSEGRARQMMRTHLLEHLKNHGPDEPIRVSRRRRTTKVQNSKKKVNSKVKTIEPVRSSRLRYSELYDEVNNLPVNNKENKVDGVPEWRGSADRAHHKLQSLNLLKIVDVPTTTTPQPQLNQVHVVQQQQQAPGDSDEETLSCCSTGSRFDDLTPPGSPSRGDHAVTNGADTNEHEADSDKSIYTEHSYTSRGTENATNGICGTVASSVDSSQNIFIKAEPMHDVKDTTDVMIVMSDSGVNTKRIPAVGREVDVNTETTTKTIKSEDLPVLCDNRRESGGHDILRDSRELRWETTAVERDEFHQHKKPKGKAKFIGQSKAEKEMAIRLINAIKTKASPAGLQSLDTLECRICRPPRCFTAPTTLMSHYRSHAGIKPYECRICRAAFTRQHSLNYHMLIHSNQTRFTCLDCGRKFRHPSHFKEHRRRHTGESPFECSDCLLRFKTRNTYKRHLKTRHGKVLTTSGGLIILSEEEFKRVRTMPRSPLSNQSSRNGSGTGKADAESEEEEDDDDYSSSGAEDMSDPKPDLVHPPVKVEIIEEAGETVESCVEEEAVLEPVAREETNYSSVNFNDIVREAMRQSDISFSNDDDKRRVKVDKNSATINLNWSVDGSPSSHPSEDPSYATAVVQIPNKEPAKKIQVYPVGAKRPVAECIKQVPTKQVPTKAARKEISPSGAGADNLATILSGQNTTTAIPQSLALLQSRYLVGSQPGLSVIGADSQQATVLLLANQNLMPRQPQADTISLMLA